MNLLFWGLTIGIIGKVMLGIGVLMAHGKLAEELTIDYAVLRTFRLEKIITVIGLLCMVVGYFIELYFYGLTPLLTCTGTECSAQVGTMLSQ